MHCLPRIAYAEMYVTGLIFLVNLLQSGLSCSKLTGLTKLLAEDMLSLTVFIKSIAVIFLLNNCEKILHCKSYSHHFDKKLAASNVGLKI